MVTTIKNPVLREVLDWTLHITVAVLLALFIVKFVGQRTLVDGSSMVPTLQDKNQLIVEKISPRFGTLHRGDIVAIYIPEERKDYIKRVIGVEGDSIEIKEDRVFVNGEALIEDYINGNKTDKVVAEYSKLVVPKGKIFVLGDNRKPGMSNDSRSIGPLEVKRVEGRAVLRYWPLNEFGTLKK